MCSYARDKLQGKMPPCWYTGTLRLVMACLYDKRREHSTDQIVKLYTVMAGALVQQ